MKVRDGFVLRNLVGEKMLMPTGDNVANFRGTVLMNELSAFVWEKLQEASSKEELLSEILDVYDIDEETAAADLEGLLNELLQLGVIEE